MIAAFVVLFFGTAAPCHHDCADYQLPMTLNDLLQTARPTLPLFPSPADSHRYEQLPPAYQPVYRKTPWSAPSFQLVFPPLMPSYSQVKVSDWSYIEEHFPRLNTNVDGYIGSRFSLSIPTSRKLSLLLEAYGQNQEDSGTVEWELDNSVVTLSLVTYSGVSYGLSYCNLSLEWLDSYDCYSEDEGSIRLESYAFRIGIPICKLLEMAFYLGFQEETVQFSYDWGGSQRESTSRACYGVGLRFGWYFGLGGSAKMGFLFHFSFMASSPIQWTNIWFCWVPICIMF